MILPHEAVRYYDVHHTQTNRRVSSYGSPWLPRLKWNNLMFFFFKVFYSFGCIPTFWLLSTATATCLIFVSTICQQIIINKIDKYTLRTSHAPHHYHLSSFSPPSSVCGQDLERVWSQPVITFIFSPTNSPAQSLNYLILNIATSTGATLCNSHLYCKITDFKSC